MPGARYFQPCSCCCFWRHCLPALSNAYGLKVIWDDQLKHASDIYIEAGDHEHLIHLRGADFQKLMQSLPHSIISTGKEYSRGIYE